MRLNEPATECDECSALVADLSKHKDWHNSTTDRTKRAALGFPILPGEF